MRKLLAIAVIPALFLGCQKKHPVKVDISPRMGEGVVEKIAVFPFASTLHKSEDPDNVAAGTMNRLFLQELEKRQDYRFVAPNTLSYAIEREGLREEEKRFFSNWTRTQKLDMGFLRALAGALECDAFLIGVVDLWQKDEADFQENTTPATYVGATVTIFDATNGEVLFQASDEDYLEGARTETSDRRLVVGRTGNVYKDFGERLFKAPPYEDVALKVVRSLVSSIPVR